MEFVDFSIAKKLKEKGFREECLAYYTTEYTLYNNVIALTDDKYLCVIDIDYEEFLASHNSIKYTNGNYVDAPTISQALDWLWAEKQIYILVEPFPSMATKDKVCWSWSFKRNSDGVNIDHTFPDDFTYLTSKEAALVGIEYTLNNLI